MIKSKHILRSPNTTVNLDIKESAASLNEIEELMKKLSASTEELSNSSKRLEKLTAVLTGLTVLLAGTTIIGIFSELLSTLVKAILIFFIVISFMGLTDFLLKKSSK